MLHMWLFSVHMSPSFLVFVIIHTDLSRMMKYHHKKMIGQVWLVIISRLLPYVCCDDLDDHFLLLTLTTHMHDNFTEDDLVLIKHK